ncbi:MAG: sigma factor-like helix-turn-helix DNA-binding protein [Janthinobacterium lividum]
MDDGRARAALARLTENEKACLRRRLLPQTAKEMAIDLGVSPHAVEKRLKMARAKLGVTSSLHAARLLAATEGYGVVVPPPADLPEKGVAAHHEVAAGTPTGWQTSATAALLGAMLMFVAALLAFFPQIVGPSPAASSPPPLPNRIITLPADAPGPRVGSEPETERAEDVTMRAAGPAEVEAFTRSSFRTMDKDGSGYIEQAEAPPAGVGIGEQLPAGEPMRPDTKVSWFVGPRGQAMWIANMDTDRDGRASEAEYVAWDVRIWRDHVPANWAWRR